MQLQNKQRENSMVASAESEMPMKDGPTFCKMATLAKFGKQSTGKETLIQLQTIQAALVMQNLVHTTQNV